MIKATSIKVENYKTSGVDDGREVLVDLIADTKDEVIAIGNDGSTVEGLTDTDIISFGSTAVTTSFEVGTLNSSGSWVF